MSAPLPPHRAVECDQPTIFTDIYRGETNIAIWRRQFSRDFQLSLDNFLQYNGDFSASLNVTPKNVYSRISEILESTECQTELSENIAELVDMFCCLFDLEEVGLRLIVLDQAMCPRFHVDRLPCRLVTTYSGSATEWLHHNAVDRTKLGTGNRGLPDEQSGLIQNGQTIQQLKSGDVALLKGEYWDGNENAGLVHRSPPLSENEKRLLLTLDFLS